MTRAVRAMLEILPCTDRDLTHVLCGREKETPLERSNSKDNLREFT